MYNIDNMSIESDSIRDTEKTSSGRLGGVSAKLFFIPIVVVLAILNITVIVSMVSIFSMSSQLSQATQDSNTYITDATSLLGGTSLLSETASNYVLKPITGKGEPNVGPLNAYANEMGETDHRGSAILSRFETYQVSEDVLGKIRTAAQSADALIDLQKRAIALTSSVYPLPEIPTLANLDLPALSAEDAALSDEEKLELAQSLVLDTEYGELKGAVSSNVNAAVGSIRASSGAQAAAANSSIGTLRTLLIAVSTLIVIFLAISLFMLYRLLISPLGRFSRLIVADKPLDDKSGLREMRLLAGSYNDLLHRRDALENILREAAETDTLTGLPNRYSMQQDQLDAGSKGYSLAVALFDVDNLKTTNDTLGHAAGDDLIRRAAYCISTCFASTTDAKCYRIGGDEFAAIIKNLDESELSALAPKFEDLQRKNNVSISWGYSYASEFGGTSFKALLDEADRQMYLMKEKTHQKQSQSQS